MKKESLIPPTSLDGDGITVVGAEAGTAHHEHDEIPEGGYGWVCVGCVFTINGFTWGVAASYGVFLNYYLHNETFHEATPLDWAFVGGLGFGVPVLIASPITIITRRLGVHIPMSLGCVFQLAGFVAASFARRIWQLYLTQGVLVGLGIGFTWIPSMPIVSQWFHKRRSLANGICSAGSGIGGVIFSFGTEPMIRNISFAWALRIIGIVSATGNIIATVLIRSRNEAIQPRMRGFDLRLLRRPTVLLLLSWGFFSILGYMVCLYSLSAFGRSIGLSDSQAANLTGFLNLGTAIGRPCIGVASDRFGRIRVAGIVTFICALTIFAIWLPANSYGVTILYALLNGAIVGVFWMTVSPLSVEIAGLKELQSVLALMWAFIILPATFSEVIALKLRRPNLDKEYLYPQIFSGTAYLVATAAISALYVLHNRKQGLTHP
ncbi:MFS general substrate transporter [Patellaria atrata CBS 101060]|uniref:MFS general substrate transporter n=1 Tax=Patellaria atrata CBS 101060 TaxID=1346257 RepID=A0A9P4S5K0_9PEZI|nr:MFS general substrate transporter [Patellaria atrata CBS 101060]